MLAGGLAQILSGLASYALAKRYGLPDWLITDNLTACVCVCVCVCVWPARLSHSDQAQYSETAMHVYMYHVPATGS